MTQPAIEEWIEEAAGSVPNSRSSAGTSIQSSAAEDDAIGINHAISTQHRLDGPGLGEAARRHGTTVAQTSDFRKGRLYQRPTFHRAIT
jgi:hypothetical protein